MEMIKNLQINNYKSISQLNLTCSRINVFVGEPNVGKSNILEALDLSYLSSLILTNNSIEEKNKENGSSLNKINIKEFFRVNSVADLFHLGDLTKLISINTFNSFLPFSLSCVEEKNGKVFPLRGGSSITEIDNNCFTNRIYNSK